MVFPISNDVFLFGILIALIVCIVWENSTKSKDSSGTRKSKHSLHGKSLMSSPIHSGSVSRNSVYMDLISLTRYMPLNILTKTTTVANENIESVKIPIKKASSEMSVKSSAISTKDVPQIVVSQTETVKSTQIADLAAKIIFPYMPGCEPNCPGAEELHKKFPQLSRTDIIRFLVARKGDVKLAEEMIEKSEAWHSSFFPLKKKEVEVAMRTDCFVPFGQSRDGSPVVYMRGGLYDNKKATPEQFVLAAAHTIEYSLAQYPDQVNVTVICHTANVPGHPPATADMDFIKLFIKVLSDNYPERLKRLAIFPFPWYGRAIWSICKVFLDKRTQDKVLLLSHSGDGIPEELKQFMDINEMPECCGGKNKRPLVDLITTLVETPSETSAE